MPLTELAIKHAKPSTKKYTLSDGGSLYLMITPSGNKLWKWRYLFNGKNQTYAIGKYPAISLAKARELRNAARALVEEGKHPTREKKANKLRNALDGENTLKRVSIDWLDNKKQGHAEKYKKLLRSRLEEYVFPSLGALPITQITTPEIVTLLEKIAAKGKIETAKRIGQMIAQVFRYSIHKGLCTYNPAFDLKEIIPSKKTKHHACIHPSELSDFLKKMDSYKNKDIAKAAMNLLALTFVRTKELIGARWEEIKWDLNEWHIPAERMKMKTAHIVPLAKQSIKILKQLHEITGKRELVFFSAASKSKHISNGTFLMSLNRMGYNKTMTGHGFRTLASTILNEKGYNPDIIEKQLAHEERNKVRSAYNRAEYLPERKRMMQDYADLLDAVRNNPKQNILQFKKYNKKS